MTNFTRLSAICAVAISVFAAGCSDDDTTAPVTTKAYTPTAQGNVRVYKHTELDTSNVAIAGMTTMDSVVTGTAMTYAGMNAYMESYFVNGVKVDSLSHYISKDSSAYYRFESPFDFKKFLTTTSPVIIPMRWVKEADFKSTASSWVAFDTTLTNLTVTIAGFPVSANLTVKQTRSKGSIQTISYGNPAKTGEVLEFISKTNFTGKAMVQNQEIPINFDNTEKIYFADNIGIVKRHTDSYNIPIGFPYPVTGFDYTLQSYVNK